MARYKRQVNRMATIYRYNTGDGSEFFAGGIHVLNSVQLNFMNDLLDPANISVITEVSVQNSETIQFFLTFDDIISWFYFGKGMGTMSIRGLLLTNQNGTPGLPVLLSSVMRQLRGKAVAVSIGNAVFACVLTNFTLNLTQDPAPVVDFTLSMNIVNHNLPLDRNINVTCAFNPATGYTSVDGSTGGSGGVHSGQDGGINPVNSGQV